MVFRSSSDWKSKSLGSAGAGSVGRDIDREGVDVLPLGVGCDRYPKLDIAYAASRVAIGGSFSRTGDGL